MICHEWYCMTILNKISRLLLLDPSPTSHCCYEFDPEVNGRKVKEATFSVRNGMKKDAVVLMEAWEVCSYFKSGVRTLTFFLSRDMQVELKSDVEYIGCGRISAEIEILFLTACQQMFYPFCSKCDVFFRPLLQMSERHWSRQFIATKPPRSPQKVVKSKGILPKMAETFSVRIYFINCPDWWTTSYYISYVVLGISKNNGTPKSSILQ